MVMASGPKIDLRFTITTDARWRITPLTDAGREFLHGAVPPDAAFDDGDVLVIDSAGVDAVMGHSMLICSLVGSAARRKAWQPRNHPTASS